MHKQTGATRESNLFQRASAGARSLQAYEPGMPIEELRRELAVDDVIKLASNENPLGPSTRVVQKLGKYLGEGNLGLYPDGGGFHLKRRLSKFWDIAPSRITLGNGSSDILDFMAHLFLAPGRVCLFSQYAFAVYPIATKSEGAEARIVPAFPPSHPEMPYGHDLDAFEASVDDDVGLVFIANPNNPTGTWLSPQRIEGFLERVPTHVPVVLDEAYSEYQDGALRVDSRGLLERFPNLVVAHTFAKAYGLAGLRLGYGLSSPGIADLMNRIRPPFNVNTLALMAGEVALDDQVHVARSAELNATGRKRLMRELKAMKLKVLPSQANFVCVGFGRDSAPIHRKLLEAGVIVRPLASYGMPQFLRVTVGTEKQNTRFLDSLRQALKA